MWWNTHIRERTRIAIKDCVVFTFYWVLFSNGVQEYGNRNPKNNIKILCYVHFLFDYVLDGFQVSGKRRVENNWYLVREKTRTALKYCAVFTFWIMF